MQLLLEFLCQYYRTREELLLQGVYALMAIAAIVLLFQMACV